MLQGGCYGVARCYKVIAMMLLGGCNGVARWLLVVAR